MDIYFFSLIINIIWYIFTILFVLYRFTTFFSWIWNFFIFLGNLMSCFKWFTNKVTYIYNYYNGYRPPFQDNFEDLESNPYEPLLDKNEKSMIMKVKDNITNLIPDNWFKQKENNELYELYISELNTIPKFTKKGKSLTQTSLEYAYFNSASNSASNSSSNSASNWISPLEEEYNTIHQEYNTIHQKYNTIHEFNKNEESELSFDDSNLLLESKYIKNFNQNSKKAHAILQLLD